MERPKIKLFKKYLKSYLSIYWMRPENAVWRAYDAMSMKSIDWRKRPSVDLCCADGVNSFILCGGRFDVEFDSFISVRDVSVKDFFSGKKDIYDYPFDKNQIIAIARRPTRSFDYGIDWKNNSLQKAAKLGLYKHLICQDVTNGLLLGDKSVKLIFSNSIYWMRDVRSVMLDLNRVLTDDGKIVILMPSMSLSRHYIYQKYLKYGWDFCRILDMGRHAHVKNFHDFNGWKKIFNSSGFKINSSVNYLSGRLVEISEIGLRPLSNVLIKMANCLSLQDRKKIKEEWIETLMYIIMPMITDGFLCDDNGEQTFFMFELSKK